MLREWLGTGDWAKGGCEKWGNGRCAHIRLCEKEQHDVALWFVCSALQVCDLPAVLVYVSSMLQYQNQSNPRVGCRQRGFMQPVSAI